jgi:hypothetical protein
MASQDSHSFQSPLVRRKTPDALHPVTGKDDEEENNILPAWGPLRMTMQTPQSRRFSTDHRDGRSRFGAAPGTAATAVKTGFKARLEAKRHKEEDWILPFERALNVEGRLATTSMKTSAETERISHKSQFNQDVTPPLESLTDLMDTMSLGKDAREEDATKGTPSHNILCWSPSLPSGRNTLARQSTKFTKGTLPVSIESGRSHRWTSAHDVIISLRHNMPEAPVPVPVPIPLQTGTCLWSPADILSTPDKLKSSRQANLAPPAQSFQELKDLRRETEAYLTQSQVQGGPRFNAERTFQEQRQEVKLPQPTLPPLAPKREVVVEERFARLKALRHQADQVLS